MPVYIRKQQHIDTPESIYDEEKEKKEFINDPDLWKDVLPQPYRRIDKILQEILEDVWNIIVKHETEKNIELSKPRPNKFGLLKELEDFSDITCICPGEDDDISTVFMANHSLLTALDINSMSVRDKIGLDDHSQAIISINCAEIKKSNFLVTVITDKGNIHMFVFAFGSFYTVQTLVENEAERRISFVKCEIADKADFIAVLIEPRTNSLEELSIEVYKFTRDSWSQQLQALDDKNNATKIAEIEHSNDNFQINEPPRTVFNRPTMFARIKPPAHLGKIQPVLTPNLHHLLKATENVDIVGLGANHFYSKSHLDLKTQLFEKTFNVQLNENPFILNNKDINFKFFYANRTLPFCTTDKSFQQDIPNSLMVCWDETNHMLFYGFSKLPKDYESKIDYCLPFSSEIIHMSVTKRNSLIAVSLLNNSIVVFDLNASIQRKCVHIDTTSIKSLYFLSAHEEVNYFEPQLSDFKTNINTQLICLSEEGNIYLVDCTLLNKEEPKIVYSPKFANEDDKFCYLNPCKHLPSLALVVGITNKMYLLDIFKGSLIVELDFFPIDLSRASELLFIVSKSKTILIKQVDKESPEKSKIFAQNLNTILKLKEYYSAPDYDTPFTESYSTNTTIDQRIKILLKQRVNEQIDRRERLANVWNRLYEQKNVIQG